MLLPIVDGWEAMQLLDKHYARSDMLGLMDAMSALTSFNMNNGDGQSKTFMEYFAKFKTLSAMVRQNGGNLPDCWRFNH